MGYLHWHVDAQADGESVSMEIDEAGVRLRFGEIECDEAGCHDEGQGFIGEVIRLDDARGLASGLAMRAPMLSVTGL